MLLSWLSSTKNDASSVNVVPSGATSLLHKHEGKGYKASVGMYKLNLDIFGTETSTTV